MKKLKRFPLTLMAFLVCTAAFISCSKDSNLKEVSDAFHTPSFRSHPGAFWCWLNGNMSKERITYDLENMKAKGINRAEIWDVAAIQNGASIPGGKGFMNDESVELIRHAIAEGKRLKMTIGMVASSGWNAGGTWVTPDWASKRLYHSEMRVKGPRKLSEKLPFPQVTGSCPKNKDNMPVYHREVAVFALPYNKEKTVDRKDVVNLTSRFKDGRLEWEVPEGEWSIVRIICSNTGQYLIVPTPNSSGLFIDFLDPEATERHLQYFMDRLGVTPENAAEKGLDYYEFDSMELAEGTPWTDKMPAVFKDLRGYSLDAFYPVLAGWKYKDKSDKAFMYDFRKTVSDRLIFSHYVTGTKFLKKYDAQLVSESGGPGPPIWNTCPVDALKALGCVSMPRGEFWIKNRNMFLVKEVASAAHIYGNKYVDAESFTTWRRWLDAPFELKRHLDRAFCEGLTNVTFHTFASTHPQDGYPGRTYHAGIDINTGTTWWSKSAPFMQYISRCCEMLKQGLFVADVCYYYGDKAPNFFPLFHDVPEIPRIKGLGKGYDYDVVNSDVLLNRMSVKDGRIVLPDQMSYALLVLQDSKEMRLEILKKIDTMVMAGARVTGPKPEIIPGKHSAAEEKEFKRLADKLWNSGKIVSGITADEVLAKAEIGPDFCFNAGPDAFHIDYIHRASGDCEMYFLANTSDQTVRGNAGFRVQGKVPEIWDPSTGEQFIAGQYEKKGNGTAVALSLPPHASLFVVFSNSARKDLKVYRPDVSYDAREISSPWTVGFDPAWGGPEKVVFNTLKSWTDSEDAGMKYYSGTAVYRNTFTVDKVSGKEEYLLDLGEVRELAEVYVNGKSAGVLWKKPYRTDITALLHSGENELKIEVVNMWANRLTGDMSLPEGNRYCWTNQGWSASTPLLPSGLLGPVRVMKRISE